LTDRLRQIEVFLAVAQARSFTAAGQRLGMSRANVTKLVAALEARLGAKLLNRNTQHVAPTEAGLLLLERARPLLHEFEALEGAVQDSMREPVGLVRIGVPPSFGAAHLVPAVAAFTRANKGAQVVMCLDTGDAELVRDGLDLSLRIATAMKDASYIARLLVRVPQVLVASPAYLARRGAPAGLDELAAHDCLVHRLKSPADTWVFQQDGGTVAVPVHGMLAADFGEALRTAALLGEGISLHPTYMVADDIAAGRLRVVLPELEPVGLSIHAIYPQRGVPARVRRFLDFLIDWLPRQAPWGPLAPDQPEATTVCDCVPSRPASAVTTSPRRR
jgi:DNA-binding transcriptional LysR family regulator